MSDQMPDEVWLDGTEVWVPHACDGTRYIRADLYEQAEAERDEWKSRFSALEVNWLKDTEQCEQAEAARDRLRAALERLMRGEGGVNSLEQERIAQEALDHE